MPRSIFAGDTITKFRGETITLATSRAFATVIGIPPGFNALELDAPSATLEAILAGFGPRIKQVWFYDDSVPSWIEYTIEATDRNTATVVTVSTMQTADRLYIQTAGRPQGIKVDVSATNGAGTATATWEFPDGTAWTNLSATDGTRSARTFDQDGLVTWTMPTLAWGAKTFAEVSDERLVVPPGPLETERGFWMRMRPSANLADSSITLAELTALMNDTLNTITPENEGQAAFRLTTNNGAIQPYRLNFDRDSYGSVELVSTSITSAANLNWLRLE